MSIKIGLAPQCSIVFTEDKKVIGGTAIRSPLFQFKIFPIASKAEDPLFTTVAYFAYKVFLRCFSNS